MIRLRKLTMGGFRGARFSVSLDFTAHHRSMAIFGENASGKSTLTDAVEWFLRDRVDHLWREDCKEASLRNVKIGPSDDATVSVEFNEKPLSASKALTSAFDTKTTNKSAELKDYLEQAGAERHLLRHADLTSFISKTKKEKRDQIADIIGYHAVLDFRNVIQFTLNALQRDTRYTTAKELVQTRQARLLELAGTTIATKSDLYTKGNELVQPHHLSVSINDDGSFDAAVEQLKSKIGDRQKAEKQLKLRALKTACDDLTNAIATAHTAAETFLPTYKKLVENKDKIKQLNLEDFLRKGQHILDGAPPDEGACPFCGAPIDVEYLKTGVEGRLRELEANRREYEETRKAQSQYTTALNEVVRRCGVVTEKSKDLHVPEAFSTGVVGYQQTTAQLASTVAQRFEAYENIDIGGQRQQHERAVLEWLRVQAEKAAANAQALEMSGEERALLDTIEPLNQVRELFTEFARNQAIKQAYEAQITTMDAIFKAFIAEQNEALQDALDLMSANTSRYYNLLHPEEDVDDVRLRIVGEEGVEFEYAFHGKKTYPPMKYLSESHLNSLGIALFLASVKLFNRRSQYFVLDDVVTSFDTAHRRRLIRLLKEEFKEWQVIVLTHESFWFDLLKHELASDGWLFMEAEWDPENGLRLKESAKDLRELIKWKRSQHLDVTNDVRRLMEKNLKEVCHALKVKVDFRYNDTNEKRMNGELLAALRGTINKKSASLKNHPIFAKLDGSNAVGTAGSHDNPERISHGDIAVALQDIDELEQLFRCEVEVCSKLVSIERPVPGDKRIACVCGKKTIDWKE